MTNPCPKLKTRFYHWICERQPQSHYSGAVFRKWEYRNDLGYLVLVNTVAPVLISEHEIYCPICAEATLNALITKAKEHD